MNRLFFALLVTSLFVAFVYPVRSSPISAASAGNGSMVVAILPLELLQDGSAKVAGSLTEELKMLIHQEGRFTIVPDEQLKPLFQSNADAQEIASALAVDFLVTGSVYAGGGRRFVALRIEDGMTGDILWFENYDYTNITPSMLASFVYDNLTSLSKRESISEGIR